MKRSIILKIFIFYFPRLLCKFVSVLRTQAIQGSVYYQILITIDRTLNTLYFNRFPFLKKIKNLVFLTILIEVFVAITNILQFWRHLTYTSTVTFKNATNETITQTSVTCEADNDIVAVLGFFGFLGRFVPFIVNIIMNLILIMGVIKSKKNVNRENRISTKDKTFAYSLILQNVVFFVFALPSTVINLLQIVYSLNDASQDTIRLTNVYFNFAAWFNTTYEALPFFTSLAFNKIFRAEFFLVMKIIFKKLSIRNWTYTRISRNSKEL